MLFETWHALKDATPEAVMEEEGELWIFIFLQRWIKSYRGPPYMRKLPCQPAPEEFD